MTFAYLHPPQNSHTMRNSDSTKNALTVTAYNLRGLHEISTKHPNTEGDLGMSFPEFWRNPVTMQKHPSYLLHTWEIQDPKFFCLTFPCLLLCLFIQTVDLKTNDQKNMTTQRPMANPHLHCSKLPISKLHPPIIMCLIWAMLMAITKLHQVVAAHWIATDLGRHNPTQASHVFSTKAIQGMPQSWQNLGGFRTMHWKTYFNFWSALKLSSSWTRWSLQVVFGWAIVFYSMPFLLVSPYFPRSTHWGTHYDALCTATGHSSCLFCHSVPRV